MSQYFPKPFKNFGGSINVKVDLSNYVTKSDIKNNLRLDTSRFALKTKLVPVPVDLIKLSNAVKNDIVKKAVYDKLVAKVNNIDTSAFVLKTEHDTDKSELVKKWSCDLVKKTDYNSKISEIENKIPSISGLATTSALTAVENKIPNVSNLVKKTDYNTKINEIEKKKLLIIIMINILLLQNLIR